jgi:hypothetical protein
LKLDAATIEAAPGPHPAASPYDKGIGQALGVEAFGLYQIELPPGAETVAHDHAADGAEDAYAVIRGVIPEYWPRRASARQRVVVHEAAAVVEEASCQFAPLGFFVRRLDDLAVGEDVDACVRVAENGRG